MQALNYLDDQPPTTAVTRKVGSSRWYAMYTFLVMSGIWLGADFRWILWFPSIEQCMDIRYLDNVYNLSWWRAKHECTESTLCSNNTVQKNKSYERINAPVTPESDMISKSADSTR